MKDNRNTDHVHSDNVFDNVEIFIEKFDGEDRDKWQKPHKVIESFNLPNDAVVVEMGSGTGYFAIRLAPLLKNGKLICIDQSYQMTSYLEKRTKDSGFINVYAHTIEPGSIFKLGENVDLIFSVDVYHHMKDRIAYFSNIAKYLKPNGAMVVIDRTDNKMEGQPTGHRVPKEKVKSEMKEAGLELINDLDFLLPVQYYLTFTRAK